MFLIFIHLSLQLNIFTIFVFWLVETSVVDSIPAKEEITHEKRQVLTDNAVIALYT